MGGGGEFQEMNIYVCIWDLFMLNAVQHVLLIFNLVVNFVMLSFLGSPFNSHWMRSVEKDIGNAESFLKPKA